MYKAIFIIVPSCSDSEWLNDRMMQMTTAFIATLNVVDYPTYVVKDYNEINNYLDKAQFLIVATAGYVLIERDHVWNQIQNISQDTGLLSYLLQFENDTTPYIHEQFFIINTSAVDHIDLSFDKTTDYGIELLRSEEDLHDGHAPLYICLGDTSVKRNLGFGSKLIEQCLTKGYKVRNFDTDWRYPPVQNEYVKLDNYRLPSQGYCYPKKSTYTFEQCLKDLTIRPGLDESQEIFISIIKNVLDFKVLNAWQYDNAPKMEGYLHVLAPATGFLAELAAYNCGIKKITFYDKNKNNIEFKKHLYDSWDGNDYDSFAIKWAADRGLALEPSFDLDKQVAEQKMAITRNSILKDWQAWKSSVSVEFICDDLINSQSIMNAITDKTIIYTSTILGIYPFTAIVHSKEDIDATKQEIVRRAMETDSIWIEK